MRQGTTWSADTTAIVEPGAQVGNGTRIWHHSHVRAGASIGENTSLGKNVYVDTDVVIGSRVKVQNNVSVYRGVTLADDVFVGPSSVFTNDRYPRATSSQWHVIPTLVQRGASIGANATIVCGVTLGEWSAIAAGAVVTHDVAPHQLVMGSPARPAGWVCQCGRIVSRESTPPPTFDCGDCQAGPD